MISDPGLKGVRIQRSMSFWPIGRCLHGMIHHYGMIIEPLWES